MLEDALLITGLPAGTPQQALGAALELLTKRAERLADARRSK